MKKLQKRKVQQEHDQQKSLQGVVVVNQETRTQQYFTLHNCQALASESNISGT